MDLSAAKDLQKQVSTKLADLTSDIQVEDKDVVKLDQYLKDNKEKSEEVKKEGFVIDDEDDVIDTAGQAPKVVKKQLGETVDDGSSDEDEKKPKNPMLDLGPKKKSLTLKKGDRVEISMVERLMKSNLHLTVTKEVKNPGLFVGLLAPNE